MLDMKAELLEAYRATPQTLQALVRGVDAEQARRRPVADSWSVVEIVAHLADAEELGYERVRRMLAEERPAIEGFDQLAAAERRRYHEMDLGEALRRFEEHRAAMISTLEELDTDGWERVAHHNELGDITIESLIQLMAFHDAIHLAQIGRILVDERDA